MDSVVHFEMPYEDRDRVAKFYQRAFGWQMEVMPGAEMGDYVLAMTTESTPKGPVNPGAINGGFFQKKPEYPSQFPSVVISVDDIAKSMKQVTDGGGKVLGEPMDIPGIGRYVSFVDPEGNRVSMLQAVARG